LLCFISLVFYRVPYLVRVKADVEYLRRLIDIVSRDPDFDDSLIDHDSLTLDLDPAITDTLWRTFMADPVSKEPFQVHQTLEGHWRMNESGEQLGKRFDQPASTTRFQRARQMLMAGIVGRCFAYARTFSARIYGVAEPESENEFKVQRLVSYAKEAGYAIELTTWEGRPFPKGSRESKLQAVAISACGFMFQEYACQAWYWEIVELSKELVITTGIRFIRPGTSMQVFAGLLLIFSYMQAYMYVDPFISRTGKAVGYLSYVSLFGLFFLGCVLITRSSFTLSLVENVKVATGMMWVLILSMFILPVWLSFRNFYAEVMHELKHGGHETHDHALTSMDHQPSPAPDTTEGDDFVSRDVNLTRSTRLLSMRHSQSDTTPYAYTWYDVFAAEKFDAECGGKPLPSLPFCFRAPSFLRARPPLAEEEENSVEEEEEKVEGVEKVEEKVELVS